MKKYATLWREALAVEARHGIEGEEYTLGLERGPQTYPVVGRAGPIIHVEMRQERKVPAETFVRVTVRHRTEAVVARVEGPMQMQQRVLRCREGTPEPFLNAARAAGAVRVEEFDSVIAHLRADAALLRSATRPAPVVLALARDGAGEKRAEDEAAPAPAPADDPWAAPAPAPVDDPAWAEATDGEGRTLCGDHPNCLEDAWSPSTSRSDLFCRGAAVVGESRPRRGVPRGYSVERRARRRIAAPPRGIVHGAGWARAKRALTSRRK